MSENLIDVLSMQIYKRTRGEAWEAGRCIDCWSPVPLYDLIKEDREIYQSSALCPHCADKINLEEL